MKQRSRSGGKPIKGRRRKTPAKRRNAPNDTPAPNVPNSKNDLEFRRLTRELSEAREQQAATSEVLKAISGSTFDLRTVLDTLLQSAVRLCGADQGTVAQRKGDTFYRSVSYGLPAYLDYVKDIPVKPGRDTGRGRALLEGKVDPHSGRPGRSRLGRKGNGWVVSGPCSEFRCFARVLQWASSL
jgi:hypothetical protein